MERYDELICSLCLNGAHEDFFCVNPVQALIALVCIGAVLKLYTKIKRIVGIFLIITTSDS